MLKHHSLDHDGWDIMMTSEVHWGAIKIWLIFSKNFLKYS